MVVISEHVGNRDRDRVGERLPADRDRAAGLEVAAVLPDEGGRVVDRLRRRRRGVLRIHVDVAQPRVLVRRVGDRHRDEERRGAARRERREPGLHDDEQARREVLEERLAVRVRRVREAVDVRNEAEVGHVVDLVERERVGVVAQRQGRAHDSRGELGGLLPADVRRQVDRDIVVGHGPDLVHRALERRVSDQARGRRRGPVRRGSGVGSGQLDDVELAVVEGRRHGRKGFSREGCAEGDDGADRCCGHSSSPPAGGVGIHWIPLCCVISWWVWHAVPSGDAGCVPRGRRGEVRRRGSRRRRGGSRSCPDLPRPGGCRRERP